MSNEVVDRFLAAQPPQLTREAMAARFGVSREGWGTEWTSITAELGIPCPDALVLLGRAMADHVIYFSFERHSYAMLTPEEAKVELAFMATFPDEPLLLRARTMLPVFGEDGDLLLLDRDGAIHAYQHDDWHEMPLVAESLEDLLARTTAAALNLGAPRVTADTSDIVAAFLAKQPPELTREAVAARSGTQLRSWGKEWSALAQELGMPCPPALVRLADAMAKHSIYFRFGRHSYGMLTPESARKELAFMATFPDARTMLPVFGQDGDLLMLDREGAIHAYRHDDWQKTTRVAESLEDLLARTTAAPLNL